MADTRTKRRPPRRPIPRPTSTARARTLPTAIAAILIAAAALAAYSNSFAGTFVFDDEPSLEQNVYVRSLWPLTQSMRAPTGSTLAGRPVASLSFALDYARAGGHSLAAYHVTNLAIHIGAALLLFGIARRTLLTSPLRARFGDAAAPLAAAIALLWALHPLQTASVTYIVQRVESLMGLFYLATLYCAIRGLDSPRRAAWGAAAAACCALGMGTKEVMATAPIAVLLWDWTFAPERLRSRRWLYAALASCWIVLAVLVAGGPRSYSVGFGFAEWPWWRYLLTQAGVVAHYVRLSLVPWPLVLDYEWQPSDLAHAAVPGLFVLALVAATAWALARRRPLGFAGAWFFVILAPTSTFIPIVTEVAAEHRLYVPVAAPIALVVLGSYALAARQGSASAARLLVPAAAAIVIVAGVMGALTYARNEDYADYDRIWSKTIASRPHNTRALNNYATSLMAQRRFDEAERLLRTAVEVNPAFAEGHANLGVALCSQGRCAEGIGHLRRSADIDPERPATFRNLAEAFGAQGQMRDALENYTRALALLPDDVGLLNRAAWILATSRDAALRDGARARAYAEQAVRLTARRDAESLDSLAAALAELGDFAAAAAAETDAIAAARGTASAPLLPELEARLELYRRGQKFRDAT